MRRTALGLLILALVVPLALLGRQAAPAEAHAVLVRSSPESRAQLPQAPASIEMWFSEPLEPGFSTIELFASNGEPVELAGLRVDPADDHHLSALTTGLEPDIYTAVYRTLSTRDGHEWSGSLTFTVLNEDGTIPAGEAFSAGGASTTSISEVTGRWLVFAAVALFAGGALIALLAAPWSRARAASAAREAGPEADLARMVRRLALRLALAGVPLAVGGSLIQLLARQDALGGSLTDLLADTRFGSVLLWRGLALLGLTAAVALALLAARRRREAPEVMLGSIAALVTVGALVTIAQLSHAAAAPGAFWALLTDAGHLLLAAAWVGGLVVLAALLFALQRAGSRHDRLPVARLVARFSVFSTLALGILAATGIVRTAGEIPTAPALFDTNYGQWLLVKLALLAIPLALAVRHRTQLAAWRRGRITESAFRGRLRRSLLIEAAAAVGIFGVVAVLGQVPTPRGNVDAQSAATGVVRTDVNLIQQANDLSVHLQVSPGTVGSNELRVHIYHPDGSDIGELSRVLVTLSAGLGGGDEIEPLDTGSGIYTATANLSALAVDWSIGVDIRRPTIDDSRTSFTVPIALPDGVDAGTDRFGSPAPQLSRNFLWALTLFPIGASLLVLGTSRSESGRRPTRFGRALPRPSTRLGGTVALFAATVLAISGSPHSHGGESINNPTSANEVSVQRGMDLYQSNCTGCHGATGDGRGPLAATLTPPPANLVLHIPLHTEGDTFLFIANGFPNTSMPAWADTLTDAEIWDVVNYLRTEFAE